MQYISKTVSQGFINLITKVKERQRDTAQFLEDSLLCIYGHKQVSHKASNQEGTIMCHRVPG